MSAPDIWGAIVPAWLGGVGGMAAAVVGTIALLKSLKTQGGVETLKSAANAVGGTAAPPSATSMLSSQSPSSGATTTAAPRQSPVSWTAWHEARSRYRLRNDSTHTGATALLTGFRDVTPGGDGAASYHGELPVTLAANESVPFTIDKSLISPSVTAIELTWADSDGTERKRTLYI
ncbi:hypothetical protein K2F54_16795 [Cryobacterium sp. 1639]|uniref:hypothetical protein n=1 Tax=Cryobacterium inferilacus TaxID=2866629 RepID=UPI001C72A82B|nr:hypothetical protein [Cryobacterium sp. 1639]MBX0301630.1 hypothetical protein [Cryobacterium sp. 1639]